MAALCLLDSLINIFEESIYSPGDVIRVLMNDNTKQTALAYIGDMNVNNKYGVEYFNYKPKEKQMGDTEISEYGGIINKSQIIGDSLWNELKSQKAIEKLNKNKRYDHRLFVRAARFGDINVVKHMMSTKYYPNNPSIYHYAYKQNKKTKTVNTKISAFYAAVFFNHLDIVKLFLLQKKQTPHHHDPICFDKELLKYPKFVRIPNCDVLKCNDNKNVKFYNAELFEKLCNDSNIKMLQILLKYDSWPIYCDNSYSLYNVCCCGNLKVLKLLLQYIKNPNFINKHLPYNANYDLLTKVIPQTNLSLLNCAILYKHFNIIKYLLTEWKYKEYIILNEPIYDIIRPHTLPILVHTIMDSKLEDLDEFTLKFIDFLTSTFDPIESGINWYCDKPLNDQRQITIYDHSLSERKCFLFSKLNDKLPSMFNNNVLWLSRGLLFGSLLAATVYKLEVLWNKWYAYYPENETLKKSIEQLLWILIKNGMDWNMSKYIDNVQNLIVSYYNPYPHNLNWKVTDLNHDICSNEKYKIFMRHTISKNITNYRTSWLDAFTLYHKCNYFKLDKKIINIFGYHILDFIVPRADVLNHFKFFELKEM